MADFLQTIDFSEENLCTRCYLMLRISGDFDPRQVTELSGIAPILSYRKGDAYQTARGWQKRGNSHWSISSEDLKSSLVEDHALNLEQRLIHATHWDQILSLEGATAALVIWYEAEESCSDYSLSSTLLAKLSKFCQTFEFYWLGPISKE